MTDKQPARASVAQAQRRLEQQAASLGPDTVRALDAARARALKARHRAARPVWIGALAASIALVAVVALVTTRSPVDATSTAAAGPATVLADLDLLADETELGLLEDLDFLAWLSTVEEDIS